MTSQLWSVVIPDNVDGKVIWKRVCCLRWSDDVTLFAGLLINGFLVLSCHRGYLCAVATWYHTSVQMCIITVPLPCWLMTKGLSNQSHGATNGPHDLRTIGLLFPPCQPFVAVRGREYIHDIVLGDWHPTEPYHTKALLHHYISIPYGPNLTNTFALTYQPPLKIWIHHTHYTCYT